MRGGLTRDVLNGSKSSAGNTCYVSGESTHREHTEPTEPSGQSSSLSVTGCERDKHTGDRSDVLCSRCMIYHRSSIVYHASE